MGHGALRAREVVTSCVGNVLGLRLWTAHNDQHMERIFWEGMNHVGGWEDRSKVGPQDVFICLGVYALVARGHGTSEATVRQEQMIGDGGRTRTHFSSTTGPFSFVCEIATKAHVNEYSSSCVLSPLLPGSPLTPFFPSLRQSPFGVFKDERRHAVFEPDVQHMVYALAESWSNSEVEGTKLYHISTEGWIDRSLTCDGLHPTAEGMTLLERAPDLSDDNCQGHKTIGIKLVEYLDVVGSD